MFIINNGLKRIQSMFCVEEHDFSAVVTAGIGYLRGHAQCVRNLSFPGSKFTKHLCYRH